MPYKKIPCSSCGKLIQPIYSRNKFNHSGLCRECFNKIRREEKIKEWLTTGDTQCSVSTGIKQTIREYIYREQNGLCAICGMSDEWNGGRLVFIVDHIDGNAANNRRENLRMICPNCDSQLPTYKSKNRLSARSHRKKYI